VPPPETEGRSELLMMAVAASNERCHETTQKIVTCYEIIFNNIHKATRR